MNKANEAASGNGATALLRILPFAAYAAVGLVVSFVIIMMAWNVQMEGRAFKCTDNIGFSCFENMNTHERAGDITLPGWIWGKIKAVQAIYEAGFVLLALAITAVSAFGRKRWNGYQRLP